MVPDNTDVLAAFLERKAGDNLRSVIHYDGEEYTMAYIREDVASEYSEEDVEEIVEELFWDSFARLRQESLYTHGELNCTIRCFEDAVEMNFPRSDTEGTAVAMDAQAVEDLYSFVGDCLTILQS